MQPDKAEDIISRGEGQRAEFKENFAEENDAIETLCAFAHAEGGTVFFGVTDDGRIIGVDLGRNTLEDFANKLRDHTDPPPSPSIEHLVLEGQVIVAATVQRAAEGQLFYAFNRPYVRKRTRLMLVGPNTRTRTRLPNRPTQRSPRKS